MRHLYIKSPTPRLNGKVERSRGSNKTEFYQLIDYTNDVDLKAKLAEWETFYKCHRSRGGLKNQTLYEVLKQKLLFKNNDTKVENNL